MNNYSFGEIRKTLAAAGGLIGTIIAYVLADATIREHLPPQWVALLGGIGTVLAVFKISNAQPAPTAATAADDVNRAIDAVQAAKDMAAVAVQNAKDVEGTLTGALGGAAQTVDELVARVIAGAKPQ